MDLLSKPVLIAFLVLLLLTGYTLYNISQFSAAQKKCEYGFKIINECKYIPDKGLEKLLGYKPKFDKIGDVEITIEQNG